MQVELQPISLSLFCNTIILSCMCQHACTLGASVILNASAAGFGVPTGPVLFDESQCLGTEDRLANCRHNGVGTLNCDHSRDVGLRCQIRK